MFRRASPFPRKLEGAGTFSLRWGLLSVPVSYSFFYCYYFLMGFLWLFFFTEMSQFFF